MDSLNKRYYKIREVAEMVGLQPSTLRFWESKFTIIKPRRNDHGTRFYTPADIEVIRMIYYLVKDRGLKLEAAEDEIRRNRSGISKKYEAVQRLKDVRAELQNLLDALNERTTIMRRANRMALESEKKTIVPEQKEDIMAIELPEDTAQGTLASPNAEGKNVDNKTPEGKNADGKESAAEPVPVKVENMAIKGRGRRKHRPSDDMPSLF